MRRSETCYNCKAWDRLGGENHPTGLCRREYPKPEIQAEDDNERVVAVWPETKSTDWCLSHVRMGKKKKEEKDLND